MDDVCRTDRHIELKTSRRPLTVEAVVYSRLLVQDNYESEKKWAQAARSNKIKHFKKKNELSPN